MKEIIGHLIKLMMVMVMMAKVGRIMGPLAKRWQCFKIGALLARSV